jgi:hypothetical protein
LTIDLRSREGVGTVDAAAARVFSRLRGGPETDGDLWDGLVALTCLLFDAGHGGPAVIDVLEARRRDVDDAGVRVLAQRVLDACGYDPGFRLAPERLDRLREALHAATRDLPARWSEEKPRLVVTLAALDTRENLDEAILELSGGYVHGTPIRPSGADTYASALTAVADLLQEVVMERHHEVWPVCPVHRLGLHPRLAEKIPVWHCSGGAVGRSADRPVASGHVVADIGALR